MPAMRNLNRSIDLRLRIVEERFKMGTWSWEISSSEAVWSFGLYAIFGLDPGAVQPSAELYQSLVHPDDQLDFSNAIGLANDARLEDRKFRIIRPDGSLRWLRSRAQPHFDRSGTTIGMFGVVADVTEVVQTELALADEIAARKALARLLGGLVWRAYPDGKLIETTGWTKLTGQSPTEARDWDALDAFHPDDRAPFRDAWAKAVSGGSEFSCSSRVRAVDGKYVRLDAKAVSVRDEEGTLREWIGYTVREGDAPAPTTIDILTSAHIRAARALLDWTAAELAKVAGVSFSSVRRIESSATAVRNSVSGRVRCALEEHGIRFLRSASGGICVELLPARKGADR